MHDLQARDDVEVLVRFLRQLTDARRTLPVVPAGGR